MASKIPFCIFIGHFRSISAVNSMNLIKFAIKLILKYYIILELVMTSMLGYLEVDRNL